MDALYEQEIRERRNEWADALISGKYVQGVAALRSVHETFCCLGVACMIFAEQTNTTNYLKNSRFDYTFKSGNFESMIALPEPVRIYLGLTPNGQSILMHLNDSGVSFSVIAGTLAWLEIEEPQE